MYGISRQEMERKISAFYGTFKRLTKKEPVKPSDSFKKALKEDPLLKDSWHETLSSAKHKGYKPIKKADGYQIEDGVLLRYTGAGGDVVIPEGILWIWDGAFSGCANITSITVPEGVCSIAGSAFVGCSGLKRVSLPSTCGISLGDCGELEHIDVAISNPHYRVDGECLVTRGDDASLVVGCNHSTIPAGIRTICGGAFRNRKGLKSITIPATVDLIERSAFWGCSGLESINVVKPRIPRPKQNPTTDNSRIYVEHHGFRQDTIVIKDVEATRNREIHVEDYGFSKDNCVIKGFDTMILGCKNSIIPSTVKFICGAFVGCSEMKRIRIPSAVELIDEISFYGCTGLEYFDVAADNPTYRGEGSFLIERKTDTLVTCGKMAPLPLRIAAIGAFAFAGREELKELVIPDGVTSIDAYAFLNCRELTSVVIPASMVNIGNGAFEGCDKLTRVEIKSREMLSSNAFCTCNAISSVSMPKHLKGGDAKQKDFLKNLFGEHFKSIKFTFIS